MPFEAFVAVPKSEAKGKRVFPFTWVDRKKDGISKSRFTVADTRWKSPTADPSDLFSPTPTQIATHIFEAAALKRDLSMVNV